MPHLSKQKISVKTKKKLDRYVLDYLKATGTKSREQIYLELFTATERLMISKRLMLIYLIDRGVPTHKISNVLKMSPSTVARFEVKIDRGLFRKTTGWLRNHRIENQVVRLLADLLAIPFNNKMKPMSLGKYIDEKL